MFMFLTTIEQQENTTPWEFEAIYKKYQNMVWKIIHDRIYNEQYHEEIYVDVFSSFMDNFQTFNDEKHAVNWLKRTTCNRCTDYIRKDETYRKYHVLTSDERVFEKHSDMVYDDGLENLIKQEELEEIRKIVDNLKPKHREVIYMRYYSECSMEEIVDELNISINTAYSRLKAAKEIVRREVKKLSEEGGMGNVKK